MADAPGVLDSGRICEASLASAYRTVLDALGRHGLRATTAFVSLFAVEPEVLRGSLERLEALAGLAPAWFERALPALRRGELGGWSGARHHAAMRAAGHELAWHGATHVPLGVQTPQPVVEQELELAAELFRALGYVPRTVVFPRNQVGHLERLRRAGFESYRQGPSARLAGRAWSLLQEWNVLDARVAARPRVEAGWWVSPAGHFLNWPSGVRALVPPAVTIQRWRSLLHHAVKRDGYVHMWFHPHNLITAPAMRHTFEEVLREVGRLVRSGDMVNWTIAEANQHLGRGRAA